MLLLVQVGLKRLRNTGDNKEVLPVSIVIAARNEQDRIIPCLKSLEQLEYDTTMYEIIFVDDCSEDKTPQIISEFVSRHANWKLFTLRNKSTTLRGKKNALLHGIREATGKIICTTDADCEVPAGWLKGMTGFFKPGVTMVLGNSPLKIERGIVNQFLRFDNMFSAIASAAPTKLGYPFTSVGRNLAYRKDVYENAGGFLALKKFKSGDDIHLTERFRYLNTGKIDYCADPNTFVETGQSGDLREIIHQQIRKNSKIILSTWPSVLLALIIFSYYVLMVIIPFARPSLWWLWLGMFIIKLVLENIPLNLANKIFRQQISPFLILFYQLIYPIHIIGFSLLGLFQIYKWKK